MTYTPEEPAASNVTNVTMMAKLLLEQAFKVPAHVKHVINEPFFSYNSMDRCRCGT
jgi:hypothetical protein